MPLVMEREEEGSMSPIIQHGDVTFAFIKYNNLYLVSVTKKNANVAMVFQFLHKVVQVGSQRFLSCHWLPVVIVFVLPTNCVPVSWKHFIPLSLYVSELISHYLPSRIIENISCNSPWLVFFCTQQQEAWHFSICVFFRIELVQFCWLFNEDQLFVFVILFYVLTWPVDELTWSIALLWHVIFFWNCLLFVFRSLQNISRSWKKRVLETTLLSFTNFLMSWWISVIRR